MAIKKLLGQTWAQKIQDEDNKETLATLGTEDTG
jgi:hypothetical protein